MEEGGAWASVLLERAETRQGDPRDAALLHEIVLGVLRRRAVLDAALTRVASVPAGAMDPPVRTALRIGAYAVLFLQRIPDFAAVDTAVELVKRSRMPRAAGFVNAVMRRVCRERESLLPAPPRRGDVGQLAEFHSHPAWWVQRAVARLGWDRTEELLAADNTPAAVILRPNLRRTTSKDLAVRLQQEGVLTEPCTFVPDALRVRSGSIHGSRALLNGLAWVQDEAAQLVPLLFGSPLGARVADLCAAPGAKTFQLAEAIPEGGFVVATDRHPGRMMRLWRGSARLGLGGILPVVADLSSDPPAILGPFHQVLLDAPCSGTGTLRRHPEIRWRLTLEGLSALTLRQSRLLDVAASLVAPGGSLVYSVCSLEPEEGEEAIRGFLARHPAFRGTDPSDRLPPPARQLLDPRGSLRTSPEAGGLDGFFAAVLRRDA